MKNKIADIRKRILIDNGLYEKVLRNDDDTYEDTELGPDGKYYKKVPVELSETELDNFIKYKTFDYINTMDAKLNTMKNIMVFWLVLVIIQLILGFIIYGLFKSVI